MANAQDKFALFSSIMGQHPLALISGGGSRPLKQKGGAKQPPAYEKADLSQVPEITRPFNERIDPAAREALLRTMIERSVRNAYRPNIEGVGNGA